MRTFGKRIVILGAGYGGLTAAIELQRKLKKNEAEITLINNRPDHCIATWLHKAAAGTVDPSYCHVDVHSLLDSQKVKFVQARVECVLFKQNKVLLNNNTSLTYDYLIVSLGSEPETFGIKGLKEHSWVINHVDKAKQLNEHIETMFIKYRRFSDKSHYLHFVVGGAGFTGIQFIGELTDAISAYCKKYGIEQKKVKITSVEAGPTILRGLDSSLISYALAALEKKHVKFRIGTAIKECGPGYVLLSSGEKLKAGTVVWTGGVRGNKIIEKSGFSTKRGCAAVDETLRVVGQDHIFMIGDVSLFINRETNRPYPPTAQIAIQQGRLSASNVIATIRNQPLKSFQPIIRGTLVSLGSEDAVGDVFRHRLRGRKVLGMKWLVDVYYLFSIGGINLVLKKMGPSRSNKNLLPLRTYEKIYPVNWNDQDRH